MADDELHREIQAFRKERHVTESEAIRFLIRKGNQLQQKEAKIIETALNAATGRGSPA